MITTKKLVGFSGMDVPADADLYKCVHCGLCLQSCPTYVELGLETESPRGRLALMKAVKEERLGLTQRLAGHMELCVQCRACEAVCPSGVPFGRAMEATLAQIVRNRPQGIKERLVRWAVFRIMLPRRRILRAVAWGLKLYQRVGLQWLVREFRLLKPFKLLYAAEQQLPKLPTFFSAPGSGTFPTEGLQKRRVAILDGCVMPLMYGPVNYATVRVLGENGCEVVVPRGQACCGALHSHAGQRDESRELARKNIDVFLQADVEAIVVNSAGCGAAMKEYQELLQDDPVYATKAARFCELVRDVHEFLAELPLKVPEGKMEARVTYQDSCHLAHAQGIKDAPRAVLNAIPGLLLTEMESSDMCCGAGGIYTITQRELSGRILEHKIEHATATEPDVIATANPGCMLQMEMGLRKTGQKVRVAHVIELLDEAYRGGH